MDTIEHIDLVRFQAQEEITQPSVERLRYMVAQRQAEQVVAQRESEAACLRHDVLKLHHTVLRQKEQHALLQVTRLQVEHHVRASALDHQHPHFRHEERSLGQAVGHHLRHHMARHYQVLRDIVVGQMLIVAIEELFELSECESLWLGNIFGEGELKGS